MDIQAIRDFIATERETLLTTSFVGDTFYLTGRSDQLDRLSLWLDEHTDSLPAVLQVEKRKYVREVDAYEGDDSAYQECKMCGKERKLNTEGYCGECWQVWTS